ncbi:hypothetical protein D3C76_895070 [compost metagenome]
MQPAFVPNTRFDELFRFFKVCLRLGQRDSDGLDVLFNLRLVTFRLLVQDEVSVVRFLVGLLRLFQSACPAQGDNFAHYPQRIFEYSHAYPE